MKKILLILVICSVSPVVYAQTDIGFKTTWSTPTEKLDIKAYDGIVIDKINLKDIHIKLVDMDGDASQGKIGQETWNDLAFVLYEAFERALKDIAPVIETDNKKPDAIPAGHPLVLDIKISGDFEHVDERPLMAVIKGKPSTQATVPLTIECDLKDPQIKKSIVKTSGISKFNTSNSEKPFTSTEDKDEYKTIVDLWATRFVNVLTAK